LRDLRFPGSIIADFLFAIQALAGLALGRKTKRGCVLRTAA
jgi:hypothetical protein